MEKSLTQNSSQNFRVKAITQIDDRTLGIMWTDGQSGKYDVVELRRKCPCAVCVDEWTHERKLKDADVADTVRPLQIDSVGRYALKIEFSDGHKTGIYTFPFLRGAPTGTHLS